MYSLCLDCGATNVRAMVVDKQGAIVGKASQPNATLPGEENPEFHVWDADRIFRPPFRSGRQSLVPGGRRNRNARGRRKPADPPLPAG